MANPLIATNDEIREMTDEEYAEYLEAVKYAPISSTDPAE